MGVKAGPSKKRDEEKIKAFEIKCIKQILRVSWTQKKTSERWQEWNAICSIWSKGGNCHTAIM